MWVHKASKKETVRSHGEPRTRTLSSVLQVIVNIGVMIVIIAFIHQKFFNNVSFVLKFPDTSNSPSIQYRIGRLWSKGPSNNLLPTQWSLNPMQRRQSAGAPPRDADGLLKGAEEEIRSLRILVEQMRESGMVSDRKHTENNRKAKARDNGNVIFL